MASHIETMVTITVNAVTAKDPLKRLHRLFTGEIGTLERHLRSYIHCLGTIYYVHYIGGHSTLGVHELISTMA